MSVYDVEEEDERRAPSTPPPAAGGGARLLAARKNKRKAVEPRRLTSDHEVGKRVRLNSTGSEERSPGGHSRTGGLSRTPSPVAKESAAAAAVAAAPPMAARTPPSPVCLAPKKRFKLLREMEEQRREAEERSKAAARPAGEAAATEATTAAAAKSPGPFRPWNNRAAAPGGLVVPGGGPPVAYLPLLAGVPLHPAVLQQLHGVPAASDLLRGVAAAAAALPPHVLATPTAGVQEEPLSLVVKKEGDVGKESPPGRSSEGAKSPEPDQATTLLVEEKSSKQRNYKNMTRQRRVEANARERQRVHTITAAFDNLQAAIPTEDDKMKLSKLSVIKIATAYIMALSRMAGYDYTEDQSAPPVNEVVEQCSRLIDAETRAKKRNSIETS